MKKMSINVDEKQSKKTAESFDRLFEIIDKTQ